MLPSPLMLPTAHSAGDRSLNTGDMHQAPHIAAAHPSIPIATRAP